MILNPSPFVDFYKCKRKMMEYLNSQDIVPYGMQGGYYYYEKNERLFQAIRKMPLLKRILSNLAK